MKNWESERKREGGRDGERWWRENIKTCKTPSASCFHFHVDLSSFPSQFSLLADLLFSSRWVLKSYIAYSKNTGSPFFYFLTRTRYRRFSKKFVWHRLVLAVKYHRFSSYSPFTDLFLHPSLVFQVRLLSVPWAPHQPPFFILSICYYTSCVCWERCVETLTIQGELGFCLEPSGSRLWKPTSW